MPDVHHNYWCTPLDVGIQCIRKCRKRGRACYVTSKRCQGSLSRDGTIRCRGKELELARILSRAGADECVSSLPTFYWIDLLDCLKFH
jgi:hypothetical protein